MCHLRAPFSRSVGPRMTLWGHDAPVGRAHPSRAAGRNFTRVKMRIGGAMRARRYDDLDAGRVEPEVE